MEVLEDRFGTQARAGYCYWYLNESALCGNHTRSRVRQCKRECQYRHGQPNEGHGEKGDESDCDRQREKGVPLCPDVLKLRQSKLRQYSDASTAVETIGR